MSRTPVEVPDELFDKLRRHLDEAQLVELTHHIALENMRGRFNRALGIGSAGFSKGMGCAVPAVHAPYPRSIHNQGQRRRQRVGSPPGAARQGRLADEIRSRRRVSGRRWAARSHDHPTCQSPRPKRRIRYNRVSAFGSTPALFCASARHKCS